LGTETGKKRSGEKKQKAKPGVFGGKRTKNQKVENEKRSPTQIRGGTFKNGVQKDGKRVKEVGVRTRNEVTRKAAKKERLTRLVHN